MRIKLEIVTCSLTELDLRKFSKFIYLRINRLIFSNNVIFALHLELIKLLFLQKINEEYKDFNKHTILTAQFVLKLTFFAHNEVFERNFNYHSYPFQSILMRACYTDRLRMQRLPLRFSTSSSATSWISRRHSVNSCGIFAVRPLESCRAEREFSEVEPLKSSRDANAIRYRREIGRPSLSPRF